MTIHSIVELLYGYGIIESDNGSIFACLSVQTCGLHTQQLKRLFVVKYIYVVISITKTYNT